MVKRCVLYSILRCEMYGCDVKLNGVLNGAPMKQMVELAVES